MAKKTTRRIKAMKPKFLKEILPLYYSEEKGLTLGRISYRYSSLIFECQDADGEFIFRALGELGRPNLEEPVYIVNIQSSIESKGVREADMAALLMHKIICHYGTYVRKGRILFSVDSDLVKNAVMKSRYFPPKCIEVSYNNAFKYDLANVASDYPSLPFVNDHPRKATWGLFKSNSIPHLRSPRDPFEHRPRDGMNPSDLRYFESVMERGRMMIFLTDYAIIDAAFLHYQIPFFWQLFVPTEYVLIFAQDNSPELEYIITSEGGFHIPAKKSYARFQMIEEMPQIYSLLAEFIGQLNKKHKNRGKKQTKDLLNAWGLEGVMVTHSIPEITLPRDTASKYKYHDEQIRPTCHDCGGLAMNVCSGCDLWFCDSHLYNGLCRQCRPRCYSNDNEYSNLHTCPACGRLACPAHFNVERNLCNYCVEPRVNCQQCGSSVLKDNSVQLGEGFACNDCVDTCENCGAMGIREAGNYVRDYFYCERCSEDIGHCENCGETAFQDDLHYVTDEGDYCDNCFDQIFRSCDICEEDFRREDGYYIEGDTEYVCPSCWEDDVGSCSQCGNSFRNENLTEIGEDMVCEPCRDRYYTLCDGCEKYESDSRLYHTDEGEFCELCYEQRYGFCEECDEEFQRTDLTEGLCADCTKKRRKGQKKG